MRSLKKRAFSVAPISEARSARLAVIRWLYLASVFGLTLWLVNLFVGDRIFLRSEGLVLADPAFVALEFPATVQELYVQEGQHVRAGEVVAVVSSQTVAETIARLSTDLAIRATRETELQTRREGIEAILTLAQERSKSAANMRMTFSKLYERGNLGILQQSTAIESEFRSYQDLQVLQTEKRIIGSELATLTAVLAELRNAVVTLQSTYHEGRLRSPIDGVVVRLAAYKGSVVRAGEPFIELYGEQRYILAYVRTGTLYEVNPSDDVKVSTGMLRQRGVVTRVEPFAAALPKEFQRAFTPVDRQQVIKIQLLASETYPPLFTKVQVRSPNSIQPWMRRAWEYGRGIVPAG